MSHNQKSTAMNARKAIHVIILVLVFLTVTIASAHAQDRIITVTGKVIRGKVKKVKDDYITYRKFFRKYKIDTDKVLYIVNENGAKKVINDVTMAKNYKNYSQLAKSSPAPKVVDTSVVKPMTVTPFNAHYIERIGSSYRVDTNQIINAGKLDELIAQSPNPMVQANLKAAKTMRTLCTISKVASFPGSAGGAFASYKTVSKVIDMSKAGPVPFKTYLATGLSFVGTLSLPITSGILKNVRNKMYDKALILYSQGN
ncbi:MAG: hypothetical protein FD123_2605 [Bacteroidetes bacterium]|nr:MAG: hypothetical protein FD123_2605 [Bacteroidota bacterium]